MMTPAQIQTSTPASARREAELLDYVERLRGDAAHRVAVHIHLSRLQDHNRRDHHIRVAASGFEDYLSRYGGSLFQLSNADLVLITESGQLSRLEEAVTKLRYLFAEDPLTQRTDESESSGFYSWYHLARDYPDFLARVRQLQQQAEKARATRGQAPKREELRVPLRPADLADLEEKLRLADMTDLLRHQAVAAFIPGRKPRAVFHELYVSIETLGRNIAPGKDISANPWLFQHLTQVLDRRMLTWLAHESGVTDHAFSLNLNIGTILSPEFQHFDQRLAQHLRGRLVIELQKIDIFADMGAFRFARDFAHERGYRICLDGMTYLTLPYFDREKLGCDLVKLFWSPEITLSSRHDLLQDVRRCIDAAGPSRVILARCDSPQALEVGHSFGITLFQGRFVEQRMGGEED